MAFHLSLRVADLGRSVEFYGRLFGIPPAKLYPDYAKFELQEPPVVLSLEPAKSGDRIGLDHLGIRLNDRSQLVDQAARIGERGLAFEHLTGVTCCYARQSKIFLNDPDGHLVEIYTVDADVREESARTAPPPAAAAGTYDHLLPAPFPPALPGTPGSLTEINLRGTFNAVMDVAEARRIVAECKRMLAPGGRLTTHLLVADRPVSGELPVLPEPAAHVRRVPTEAEMLDLFEHAGVIGLELKRFSHASVFELDGAQFRELLLAGVVPPAAASPAPASAGATVVYKGPFPAITDEEGRTYRRGRRVEVPPATAARLGGKAYAEHFVFLTRGRGC